MPWTVDFFLGYLNAMFKLVRPVEALTAKFPRTAHVSVAYSVGTVGLWRLYLVWKTLYARIHLLTHARTYARTHARTHARSHARTTASMSIDT